MCLADKIHRNLYRTVSYDLHCNVTIIKKILTKNVQDVEKLLTNKCKYDMIYTYSLALQAFLFVMEYVWFFFAFVYSFYNLRLHVNIGKKLIR